MFYLIIDKRGELVVSCLSKSNARVTAEELGDGHEVVKATYGFVNIRGVKKFYFEGFDGERIWMVHPLINQPV